MLEQYWSTYRMSYSILNKYPTCSYFSQALWSSIGQTAKWCKLPNLSMRLTCLRVKLCRELCRCIRPVRVIRGATFHSLKGLRLNSPSSLAFKPMQCNGENASVSMIVSSSCDIPNIDINIYLWEYFEGKRTTFMGWLVKRKVGEAHRLPMSHGDHTVAACLCEVYDKWSSISLSLEAQKFLCK